MTTTITHNDDTKRDGTNCLQAKRRRKAGLLSVSFLLFSLTTLVEARSNAPRRTFFPRTFDASAISREQASPSLGVLSNPDGSNNGLPGWLTKLQKAVVTQCSHSQQLEDAVSKFCRSFVSARRHSTLFAKVQPPVTTLESLRGGSTRAATPSSRTSSSKRKSRSTSRTSSSTSSSSSTANKLPDLTSKYPSPISATQPFVSLEAIGQLTLAEVAETFRYAVECNQDDFDRQAFVGKQLPRVQTVLTAMDRAVASSRNNVPLRAANNDSVDALSFSAAMRILAEWRLLRQMPQGYKRYAAGMNLGHKDVMQNVASIESSAHAWLDHQQSEELCSPTLRDLLEYEIQAEINPTSDLPRLHEKTGAMGLLWVRRQLDYQSSLLENVLRIPHKFASSLEAVTAAYKGVYGKYHGWAAQKLFGYSLASSPPVEEIYRCMNPHKLHEVLAQRRQQGRTVDRQVMLASRSSGINRPTNVASFAASNARGGTQPVTVIEHDGDDASNDDYVTRAMTQDAHEHITAFLDVAKPLLDNLANLFDQLNMDDPSKV